MSEQRTIDDVTREEWARLAEAAINLLACARLTAWEYGLEKKADTSVIECLDRMALALEGIGLPQLTLQEYYARLEEVLSGKLPIT